MAASMRNPVVVILGATGTGKTQLSLEIAKLFNGEIISADAMQLYKGLDVITNKVTVEERKICRHHMIDYLSPLKENNTVVNYRDQALPIIDWLLLQKRTPVIVGGTNYYIEALLWKHLVNKEDIKRAASQITNSQAKFPKLQGMTFPVQQENKESGAQNTDATRECSQPEPARNSADDSPSLSSSSSSSEDEEGEDVMRSNREKYEAMSSTELHQRLREVDPQTANKMHPHDKRKIIRAIEVYDLHGVPVSEVYKSQHKELLGPAISGPLRYPNCCIFWLRCDQDVLDKRLDTRVDKMLELGLVDELTDFHRHYNEDRMLLGKMADYTTGVFQSIGFKEFHEYLMLNDTDRQNVEGKKSLQKGIEDLKIATRRYARNQNKWVKNRFLQRPCREAVPPVYGLDCTDVSQWNDHVSIPAATILTALRNGTVSPMEPLPYEEEHVLKYEYHECKYCNVTAVLLHTWQAHISSRKHKKNIQRYRRQMTQLSKNLDTYVKSKNLDTYVKQGKSEEEENS